MFRRATILVALALILLAGSIHAQPLAESGSDIVAWMQNFLSLVLERLGWPTDGADGQGLDRMHSPFGPGMEPTGSPDFGGQLEPVGDDAGPHADPIGLSSFSYGAESGGESAAAGVPDYDPGLEPVGLPDYGPGMEPTG